MRRTWAYNGIFIGIIAGICVSVITGNIVIGIIAAIVGSVLSFLGIRAIENLIYKGIDKAEDAVKKRIDLSNKNDAAGMTVCNGKRLCPYCGYEITTGEKFCSECGKELDVGTEPEAQNARFETSDGDDLTIVSSSPRSKKNGRGTAARFWGKFFCVCGVIMNLYALLSFPAFLSSSYVDMFEDMYYYIGAVMMALTVVGAGLMLFNRRKKSLKIFFVFPLLIGAIAVFGCFYGYKYEFYADCLIAAVLSIAGAAMVGLSACLLVAAILIRKNLINLLALIVNLCGVGVMYLFFQFCMINKYYGGELFFILSCLDLAGFAVVMLLLQGAYNSDMRFDKENAMSEQEGSADV